MGRRGGDIYVSTDPNVTLQIGTPGYGVSIGPLGPTIYGGTGSAPSAHGVTMVGAAAVVFTPATVPVVWGF